MSEAVVLYQLAILVSIVGIGTVVGQRSMVWAGIAWAVWTVVMVFTRWLFILQFATIAVAFFSGFAVQESARYLAIQSILRKGMLWLGVLAAVGMGVGLYVEYAQRRNYVAPVESAPLGYPSAGTNANATVESETVHSPSMPATQPVPQKIYRCFDVYGGETHIGYQGSPCRARGTEIK